MKITNMRAHLLEAPLSQPFACSRAWYSTRTALLVEIETDEGLTGWGECYGPARINAAVAERPRNYPREERFDRNPSEPDRRAVDHPLACSGPRSRKRSASRARKLIPTGMAASLKS
jgi:L-alanine-DL-glutamate epimerase-like enolase superfamily enzyme